MLTNMNLEAVLDILGKAGTVTLRKGTNDKSATPGHRANTTGWTCEITLAGYHSSGGSRTSIKSSAPGLSATKAALSCLEALEEFLESEEGSTARSRYEEHWTLMRDLAAKRVQSDCFGTTYKDPGEIAPPVKIEWGD